MELMNLVKSPCWDYRRGVPTCPVQPRERGIAAIPHEDGKILFTLACFIKARHIVELGTFAGNGTNYLAAAAYYTDGWVDTVDLVWYWGGVLRGWAIEWRYRPYVCQYKSDAWEYLYKQDDNSIDFIFEDSSHTYHNTTELIHLSKDKLRVGGILAVHDVLVDYVKAGEAVKDSGLEFLVADTAPHHRGVAVWRKR